MALTKISGNVVQQNNFSLSGVVTATSFTGDLTGNVTATTVQVGSATTIHTTGIDLGGGTLTSHNINSTGIITATGGFVGAVTGNVTGDLSGNVSGTAVTATTATFTNATISGDLTVQGTTTTLDTTLTEVDKLEVGANNSTVGVAITQSGSGDILRLYDGASQVVTVTDGGLVGIGTDNPSAYFSDANDVVLLKTDDCGITIASGASQKGTIAFADGTTGDQAYRGYIQYNHSTDSLQVATTGTERLRVTSTGNIGIGTDTPIGNLHLNYNGNNGTSFRMENFEGYSTFHNDGGALYVDSGQHIFRNEDGSSERIRIDSSGRVILNGTASGNNKLQINGTGDSAFVRLKRTDAASGDGTYGGINVVDNNGVTIGTAEFLNQDNTTRSQFVLKTYFGGSNEVLRVKANGNVGIGTDNPATKLHLSSGTATQITVSNTSSSMSDGDTMGTLDFAAGPSHTVNARVAGAVEGTSEAGGDLVFETRADGGSLTERLRIDSSGTLTSYSPNNSTQNIRYRGSDGNWHGYLNQSVDGGTISNIIGCGGAWDASGTSYNCTKDYNGSFPAAGLAIHNQYNSNLYPRFSFLSKAAGSTNTDGAVSEWMTIYNGNVGINRTSPNSRLHIGSGNLQVGDFSTDTYETKLGSNALTFKRNADSFIDQLGNGTINFRLGSSNTSVLKLQDSAEAVKVVGEAALTGTTGGAKGLTLQTSGGSSCPLYFGSETHSAQKSMYLNGYWIYLRGHQNEGIRFIFSQTSGNAPRSDQYEFKYNQATRPTGNTTWDGFSDRRAKENIQDVTSALDTIGRLRPVTFDWTNDYADRMNMFNLDKTDSRSYMWTSVKENGYDETRKNNNVGFIAQEFEEIFPNDVTETEMQLGDETISDFKTVNFDSLIPMLTKAVQELKSENDSLRARLDAAGL